MRRPTVSGDASVALSRHRFSLGLPPLAAGAAAPQEIIAAKAPSRDEAPIVTHYRTKTIEVCAVTDERRGSEFGSPAIAASLSLWPVRSQSRSTFADVLAHGLVVIKIVP